MRRAFITGCGGQDGSYLAEQLLQKGYFVNGLVRPGGDYKLWRLKYVRDHPNFCLVLNDLLEPTLAYEIALGNFDEVYHLAAQSQVHHAFKSPANTMEINATATLRILEALSKYSPETKMYFAATSEMFGDMKQGEKADENWPLSSRSPYASAKIAAHTACRVYRRKGLFVVSGIAFNHESARRGENFVSRKLALGVHEFKKTGKQVKLGNIGAWRDWHHASDTMNGAYLALQADEPKDYVFASGHARSVLALASAVCAYFDVSLSNAVGVTETELRPWDVDYLCGDPSRAERELNWTRKYNFNALVKDVCRVGEQEYSTSRL